MRLKTTVYQFDSSGNFLKRWESFHSIKKNNPTFDVRHIQSSCKKLRSSSNGFIWTFDKDENLLWRIKKIESKKIKQIGQFSKTGELLTIWKSIGEIIRILSPSDSKNGCKKTFKERTIRQCCQSRRKTAYHFIWKYL